MMVILMGRARQLQFWNTKEFKEIQKKWDDVLESNGFNDIEQTIKNERVLKQQSTNAYRQAVDVVRQSKIEYYTVLGQKIAGAQFENEIDKAVMEKRSEGLKIKEISSIINLHRQAIRYIIRRYEKEWGIRAWTTEQLSPQWMWENWRKMKQTNSKAG
jgi:hypothetical protein